MNPCVRPSEEERQEDNNKTTRQGDSTKSIPCVDYGVSLSAVGTEPASRVSKPPLPTCTLDNPSILSRSWTNKSRLTIIFLVRAVMRGLSQQREVVTGRDGTAVSPTTVRSDLALLLDHAVRSILCIMPYCTCLASRRSHGRKRNDELFHSAPPHLQLLTLPFSVWRRSAGPQRSVADDE